MRLLTLSSTLALAMALTSGCGSSRTPDDTTSTETAAAQASHRPGGMGRHAEGEGGQPMGQGRMGQGRMGQGRMGQGRMGQGMGSGRMGEGMGEDMDTIHSLLADHTAIERRVEDLPNGVETWTESDDPEVAARIRQHVRQMYARLENDQPMRRWDPLFVEIFENADAIHMEIEDTPRGVRVVETSEDPKVVALIRQHAHRAVSEFVERGMDRAHEPTPLPEGYDH